MSSNNRTNPEKYDFVTIGPVEEMGESDRFFIEVDGRPIVVFNISGEFFAVGDVCSHDDGPLGDGELSDYEVICPRHGAKFDVRTGKALTLPAVVEIPAYPVRVNEGQIEIGIPFDN